MVSTRGLKVYARDDDTLTKIAKEAQPPRSARAQPEPHPRPLVCEGNKLKLKLFENTEVLIPDPSTGSGSSGSSSSAVRSRAYREPNRRGDADQGVRADGTLMEDRL